MNNVWSCIVITCPTLSSVLATEREVDFLKRMKIIPLYLDVLTIKDPAENMGSGAATLNAILVASEFLSAKQQYTVLCSDVLHQARVLILHNGRNYLYSSCDKAFISLPLESQSNSQSSDWSSGMLSNLETILSLIDQISIESPCGVWVCSTDMMILQTHKVDFSENWSSASDVVLFCVPSDIEYATGHGVVSLDEQGYIADIIYCGEVEQIACFANKDGLVSLISGIVFLTTKVAESFLSLHVQSPLDSCTYLGLDSGNEPTQVSLFFDILIAMSTEMEKDTFICGKCGKMYNSKVGMLKDGSRKSLLARTLVWEELSNYNMSSTVLLGCQHLYWSDKGTVVDHTSNLFKIATSEKVHSIYKISGGTELGESNLLTNSYIQADSCHLSKDVVVCNSHLQLKSLYLGKNVFLSGISLSSQETLLTVDENLTVLNVSLNLPDFKSVFLMFGVYENPFVPVNIEESTFCNVPWLKVLMCLNVDESFIWGTSKEKTIMDARIFCFALSLEENIKLFRFEKQDCDRYSVVLNKWRNSKHITIREVLQNIDCSKSYDYRRHLYSLISVEIIENALLKNEDLYLVPYFRASCAENWSEKVLDTLDKILSDDVSSVVRNRTLSCIADLLSAKAGIFGVLRSGPGSNKLWSKVFSFLMKNDFSNGMAALLEERSNWSDRPDHLVRAARHYERATQILIQNSVKTVKELILASSGNLPPFDTSFVAECPARIDLQGGWSDTPPICYELGGSVVNVAVLLSRKKPIRARACRIRKPYIHLKIHLGDLCQELSITELSDLSDYDQPNAQGALLKAALVCTNIVDIESQQQSLKEQLMAKFNGGFEVESWSLLPQGCGMGASSILAGAVVGVLWSVIGKKFDKKDVIHAVLYVEQLLTTGGGWQDQVAGIMGGVNRGHSTASLPLCVEVEPISLSDDVIMKLNSHLLLIYTGKVRLAKNLLQNVIRSWYAKEEKIVNCFKDLITFSFEMKDAIIHCDLDRMGQLLDTYWEQKKILAPGCETSSVRDIMQLTRPFSYGQLLLGAGGGGFLCLLTRNPDALEEVKAAFHDYKEKKKLFFHPVMIDSSGLEILQIPNWKSQT